MYLPIEIQILNFLNTSHLSRKTLQNHMQKIILRLLLLTNLLFLIKLLFLKKIQVVH